jgi:hypothetical protein
MPRLYQRTTRTCEVCKLDYSPKTKTQRFCSLYCRGESKRKTIEDAFFNKIEVTDDHWYWRGYTSPKGYGTFGWNNQHQIAHRFAYEHWVGPIPEGLEIDHTCKVRNCVNPAHLEPVTTLVNQHRANPPKTHCINGHEYTEQNTRYVKNNKRQCRMCARERYRVANPGRFKRRRILEP